MFKQIAAITMISAAIAAPAHAGATQDLDTACKLEISTQLPASFDDSEVRFKQQRGSGKLKKMKYSLTHEGERSNVLCIASRDGVKEVRFAKSVQAQIAQAR